MSIAILPNRLQLVSIAKRAVPLVAHGVIKHMLFSGAGADDESAFFSYTENALEASIIADVAAVDGTFAPLAALLPPGALSVSPDAFRALRIDDESQLAKAGQRITDVSAPLAHAGISIFYLSTYQADFVFVKEKRIPLVVATLAACGFAVVGEGSAGQVRTAGPDAVLVGSVTASDATGRGDWAVAAAADRRPFEGLADVPKIALAPDLQLVGLARDAVATWALPLLRVVFYSDHPEQHLFSFTAADDGISLVVSARLLAALPDAAVHRSVTPQPLRAVQADLEAFGLDRFGIVWSMAAPLARARINLLYLSTAKTANLLLEREDVARAMALLSASDRGTVPLEVVAPSGSAKSSLSAQIAAATLHGQLLLPDGDDGRADAELESPAATSSPFFVSSESAPSLPSPNPATASVRDRSAPVPGSESPLSASVSTTVDTVPTVGSLAGSAPVGAFGRGGYSS